MKAKEIMDLIDFISKSDLDEVNIETQEFKIAVRKNSPVTITPASNTISTVEASPAVKASLPQDVQQPVAGEAASPATATNLIEIKSPMIGTFYRSGSPSVPPFVSEGDRITAGQPLCIIEAMKLFNEIESEITGTIVKVLVENSTPVEFDQPLFLIDPSL